MTDSRQKTHGTVYTPRWIVDLILDEAGFDGSRGKITDPACGDGAFLSAAAERIIAASNKSGGALRKELESRIFGADIDAAAIDKCARRLSTLTSQAGIPEPRWNLRRGDILASGAAGDLYGRFDFVVGNPPYVRIQNLGEERRRALQRDWQLCAAGSTDIYIAFMELGMRLLKDGGRLGYITPNTWLKTRAAADLRRFLRRGRAVKTLIDFEHWQLFDGATTYCLIAILEKNARRESFALATGDNAGNLKRLGSVPFSGIDDNNWILAAEDDLNKLRAMREGRTPLDAIAKIHVGITTLADNCYIFRAPQLDGERAVIRHPFTGKAAEIESAALRPIIKASVLKTAADAQHRHILFPYQKVGNGHRFIPEDMFAERYPLALAYLRSVKPALDKRDRGRENPVGWYAFGRSQGLDTSFGEKILTSPMNILPHFIVWEKPEYTFYSGYCVKFGGDLHWLARHLNSEEMAFYIDKVGRSYRSNYKSFAKSFLCRFPVPATREQPRWRGAQRDLLELAG